MGDETPFRNYYSDFRAEDRASKTVLGGLSLAARLQLFVLAGVLAITGMGGLFYFADLRTSESLAQFEASQKLAALIARLETGSLELNSDSRNFLLSRDARYAENYEKRSEPVIANLERLYGLDAAEDVRKHVATVNDGVAQHATQFAKVVEIQKIIGQDAKLGLTQLVKSSAGGLQSRVAGVQAPDLRSRLAQIRQTETRIVTNAVESDVKLVESQLAAFKRAIERTELPAADRSALNRLTDSYRTDLLQFVSTRNVLDREIARLGEINTYMAPSIEALIAFGGRAVAAASATLEATKQFIRQVLAGGSTAVLLILILIGALLMRSITRPVADLATAATRLAHGDRGVPIPALGNYDETGEVANALTFFRENMAQADRLRKELEDLMQGGAARLPADAASTAPRPSFPEDSAPGYSRALVSSSSQAEDGFVAAPISEISRRVTETSQSASVAAFEAERTESMVNGLAAAIEKTAAIEKLVSGVSDQSSLLAVQTAIDTGIDPEADDKLIVMINSLSREDDARPGAGQSVEERANDIQSAIRSTMAEMRDLGRILGRVNEFALQIAAETSTHALDTATELLRQSEDLRGMLDDLLGKIRMEGGGPGNVIERRSDSESES